MSRHLSRKVSRNTTLTDTNVEKVSRNKAKTQEQKLDRSTSYREAIEGPGTFLIDPPSCRGSIEIAIRTKPKNSTDSRVSRRYRGGVEKLSRLLKNSFSRREKHIYEWNQACNTTKDPKHTHTLNKSNQFYISKTS